MKHANALVLRNDSNDDSDGELREIRRLLSPKYRYKLAEEGSLVQEGTVKNTLAKPWIISPVMGRHLVVANVGVLSCEV